MIDDKFQKDVQRAEPMERKAMFVAMKLSAVPMVETGWFDDSMSLERKKRDFVLVLEGGRRVRFEVKADFESENTGNIALEYECNGRGSGLAATCSEVWIQMVPVGSDWRAYFASVRRLREWLMFQRMPGCWRPDKQFEGSRYSRLVSNKKSGDQNRTMNMLLEIGRHVRGKGPWMDSWDCREGSVDWRLFGANGGVA